MMNKVNCDKYEECLKDRSFDPFCYRIGPPKDRRIVDRGGFLHRRSSECWYVLTGKIWWREIGKNDKKG